jgi:hypothetical protein
MEKGIDARQAQYFYASRASELTRATGRPQFLNAAVISLQLGIAYAATHVPKAGHSLVV